MAFFIVLVVLGIVGFGFVAVRASRENEGPAAPRRPGTEPEGAPRDIPPLFPDFFHGVLFAVGKEATPHNLLALTEYVSQMISANAYGWFHRFGDTAAEARFSRRFRGGGPEGQALEKVPDDMIDFLWAWNPRARDALRDWIPRLETDLTAPGSRLWRYGDELPFGMWERED
ncbi:hypothetical protein J2X68_000763 [Streptomyces sp. 3330]|uniref:hypothetical protein n=1 Tax=Streptomyces sp. 3330 TaxID=2817755 RepID=UPI00285737C5|nr:hypothetical protein [Streptomyces sp. 3330]MDR6974085.1 hypothetical protein [Streptomyces sp. 3330]